jgi:long-chain acyl-CoA synthetase
VRALACGLAAQASRAACTSRSSATTGPRLYWAMIAARRSAACRCRCTRTRPRPSSLRLNDAEIVYALAEDQEQVDKLLEARPAVPTLRTSTTTTRAACATTTA